MLEANHFPNIVAEHQDKNKKKNLTLCSGIKDL